MKQGLINLLVFLAVTVGPLAFWKSDFGYALLEKGYGWVAYVSAPVIGLIFALVASEGKIGKGFVTKDEQGVKMYNVFWGVFVVITVILLGISIGVNIEA